MSLPPKPSRGRLTLCAGLLALAAAAAAHAQSPPPSGAVQAPTHKPADTAQKVQAAPREPVHQTGGAKPATAAKPTPVVKPHGPAHPQKPATAAQKPAAKPASAPAEAPPAASPAQLQADKGATTGQPLPRFVSLRSDEVNMRKGPGTRYPVEWVYKRRDLPVEIEREFEVWRLVEDPEGVKGWVHQATLTGRRSIMVRGTDATLRHDPQDTAEAVAVLQPGVVGRLLSCAAGSDWCQVQVGEYRGYLKRTQVWGTLPNEVVGG
jgi:SH3-like domain-containing protein